MDSSIMFQDGILEGFSPNFKSISKDCDRYSNELDKLFEKDKIDTRDYIELNGKGSLWIAYKYIEKGLMDQVEANLRKYISSRDFYGPLFENTQAILKRLVDHDEQDRVFSLYRAATKHRLKALKEEAAVRDRPTSSKQARTASAEWVKHYLPAVKEMIQDYEAILASKASVDPELLIFQRSLQELESS